METPALQQAAGEVYAQLQRVNGSLREALRLAGIDPDETANAVEWARSLDYDPGQAVVIGILIGQRHEQAIAEAVGQLP